MLVSLFFMFISLFNSLSNRFFLVLFWQFFSSFKEVLYLFNFFAWLFLFLLLVLFFFFACLFLWVFVSLLVWFIYLFIFDFFCLFVCLFLFEHVFVFMVESLFYCLFDWLQFLSSKCLVCFVLFVSFSLTLFESVFHCLFVWSIAVSVFEFDMFCSLLIFHSHCVEYRCLYGKNYFPPSTEAYFNHAVITARRLFCVGLKNEPMHSGWRASQWLCSPP